MATNQDYHNVGQQEWGGLPVFDVNGTQIGVARDQDDTQDFFILEEGHAFLHDVEVPLSIVTRATSEGIYLALSKNEIEKRHLADTPATVIPGALGYTHH